LNSITIYFFAKEGIDCNLTCTKENLLKPVTITFNEGLGQKFLQPSGTGIDLSTFPDSELFRVEKEMAVYPLAVKADASLPMEEEGERDCANPGNRNSDNSQITQAVFEKRDNGGYQVRVVKQILWVNGTRYELQEIYGIGNSIEGETDGNDPGKECVICLSEQRDTTVLPCRHMVCLFYHLKENLFAFNFLHFYIPWKLVENCYLLNVVYIQSQELILELDCPCI
jgi:E3 ubiquitin-protein ligase MGRN1